MPQLRRNSITFDPETKTFTQLDPPEKQPRVELTRADKKRVADEFIEVFGRKPTEEEKEELFIEELKLKREKIIPKS